VNPLIDALEPLFAPAATVWGAPVTWLELVAFVLAIAMVVFNIRVNPLGWPLAILSSLLYFALFWDNRLYGDASLQIFFAVIAAWGWWQWLRGTDASGGALRPPIHRRFGIGRAVAGFIARQTAVAPATHRAGQGDIGRRADTPSA